MVDYEYDFDPNVANNTAASIYRLVRGGGPKVLDLGSGPGVVAGYLTGHDHKLVTCVDNSEALLQVAAGRGVARTVLANLGETSWLDQLGGEQFDVVVLADVLEHLVDPAAVVQAIADRGVLSGGGYLVISIPNAGHEAVLAELISGRFTYQDTGLLDSTHLRFFTLASLRELLERSGFFITHVERTHRTAEQTSLAVNDAVLPPELRDRVLEAAAEAQTYQFIVRAEPASAAFELARVRQQLVRTKAALAEQQRIEDRQDPAAVAKERDEAMAEVAALRRVSLEHETNLAEADRTAAELRSKIAELDVALTRERKLTASERKRYEQALQAAKAAANRQDLAAAEREIARLETKLADVYDSRTWKAGRIAWSAAHIPARVLKKLKRTESKPTLSAPTSPAPTKTVDYSLDENTAVRRLYEQALERHSFGGNAKAVAIAVFTTDLAEGRGDLYTAVGLGRHLEQLDYEVVYLPPSRWYEPPARTDIYVAMLETVEVARLPSHIKTVAWVRNQTAVWMQQPWLPLYDLVLASSQDSLNALRAVYPGETGLLPIGVDTELFTHEPRDRSGVVTTVNQWGREREVFAYLKEGAVDFPLALYGQQRGMAPELTDYARGPISFFALPALYAQAQLVIDDFNHTTAGYGNANSRLFEAVACGAAVITNRSNGLAELGLGAIPVYSSAGDLFQAIGRVLDSDRGAAATAELRQMVVDHHSYRRRATEFDAHIEGLGERVADRDAAIVVSHYPDYRDNPYTEMMWSDLRTRGGIAIPVGADLNFTATIRAAARRRTVFHLNWTAPILGDAADEPDRLVRYRRFLEALDEMRSNGVPSIWTVHNAMPHECADPDLEAQLRQEIADRVDLVHVMCAETVTACAPWFEIPPSKVRVIPHPAYIDIYPNLVTKEIARSKLGLSPDDMVYLHFGQVRSYKGIDGLLDAFDQVSSHDSTAKLLLVGKPGRFEGARQIIQRARANPNVISNFNPVLDSDVQLYLNAADVVVLPHRKALNSGALLLAYSFARPVIAAEIGCGSALVDDSTGIAFRREDGPGALRDALLAGRELGEDHGRAAYERAQPLHYLGIGKRFSSLVDEAFSLFD